MNFIAAPTLQRAVSCALDEGLIPWQYVPIDLDPAVPLRGLKDFHLVLAGMDLDEFPALNHVVLHARACGGTVTITHY